MTAAVVLFIVGLVHGAITVEHSPQDVADALRDEGDRTGVIGVTTYRPFPAEALRLAVGAASRVIVIERSLTPGSGETVTTDVRAALAGRDVAIHTVIAGLGGRPVRAASLREMARAAGRRQLEPLTFLDLDQAALERHLRVAPAPAGDAA